MGFSKLASVVAGAVSLALLGCSPLGKPVEPEVSGSYFYGKSRDSVVYARMGRWVSAGYHIVEGADRATFRPIADHLAVDKAGVYFQQHRQYHVDRESFQVEGLVWRDAQHVYHPPSAGQKILGVVGGADPRSFEFLFPDSRDPGKWARDKDRYYLYHNAIPVDADSFQIFNDDFVADRYHIYTNDAQLRVVSKVTGPIEELNRHYLRMGNRIIARGNQRGPQVLDFEEIVELRQVNEQLLVINGHAYARGELFAPEGLDVASLEAFPESYWYGRDKDSLYHIAYRFFRIEADRKSFELMEGLTMYGRDASSVYFEGELLEGADRETFEVVRRGEEYIARDKHGEFHMGSRTR